VSEGERTGVGANVVDLDTRIARATRLVASGGGSQIPPVNFSERLTSVETSVGWIKVIGAIMVTVMIGGFGLLSAQMTRMESRLDSRIDGIDGRLNATATRLDGRVDSLSAKIDAIPRQLSEEFRAMRAEMAAQTSAIANSITATKQVQPQIIVMPPPEPAPKP
jgi:hypothetical protein